MTLGATSPDTDRRFAAALVERGLASREIVLRLASEREQRRRHGERPRPFPEVVCDAGLIDRTSAASILREVRASARASSGPVAPGPVALGPGAVLGPYRIVAELGRGGIVAVYGAEVHSGVRVVVLELVAGESLAKKLARDGPLRPHEAAVLVRDVARAVAAAHEGGVIHRDLKPANVLLDAAGRARRASPRPAPPSGAALLGTERARGPLSRVPRGAPEPDRGPRLAEARASSARPRDDL